VLEVSRLSWNFGNLALRQNPAGASKAWMMRHAVKKLDMRMQPNQTSSLEPAVQLPVVLVAEVQDSLLVVVHDLNRLDGLLAHTMANLMERFTSAIENLADPALAASRELDVVRGALRAAVTELQFQDMASQLINHTSKILQGCAYRLAAESMGSEDGEAVPSLRLCRSAPIQ
jgi:hypothetical protein